MIPLNKVKELISKHSTLETELSSGKIDKKNFAEKSKEYADLSNIIKDANLFYNFDKDKKDLEKIINDTLSDTEMKELADNELKTLIKKKEISEKKN